MKLILFSFCLIAAQYLAAQNTTRFSQFNTAKGLLNPAAVGTEAKYSAELIYRYQWLGVKGAPSTAGFIGGAELMPQMAVGIGMIHDRIGITQSTTINASYAYRVLFEGDSYLALGVNAGVQNVVSDFAQVQTLDQVDAAFERGYNQWLFNAAVGMYYNGPRMYAGLSIPELIQNSYRGVDKGFTPTRWHYYGTAGFYLGGKGNYMFNPCIQVKSTANAPIQGDLLLRNIFRGSFALTVGYRSENALVAGFDFMIANKMRFGYSFNYNVGKLSTQLGMGHELYLALGLPFYYETNSFAKRRYIGKKGNFKSDYRRRYIKKKRYNH